MKIHTFLFFAEIHFEFSIIIVIIIVNVKNALVNTSKKKDEEETAKYVPKKERAESYEELENCNFMKRISSSVFSFGHLYSFDGCLNKRLNHFAVY